jgi:mannose-6-phosphate isomerase-like protein (cupin superfamily)
MLQKIAYQETIIAIIIRSNFRSSGIQFFTPDEFSQQLAYMKHPSGYHIPPHVHNKVIRDVQTTQEVLFVKSGKLRVDFYTEDQTYLESSTLNTGDVILLASGGHGFEILEEAEIIEVKQGPYSGDHDKTRFKPISIQNIQIK